MITKCRFCDYSKDRPLDKDILDAMADGQLPAEDYHVWLQRLVRSYGFVEYIDVGTHIAIEHEDTYGGNSRPDTEFSEEESDLISKNVLRWYMEAADDSDRAALAREIAK